MENSKTCETRSCKEEAKLPSDNIFQRGGSNRIFKKIKYLSPFRYPGGKRKLLPQIIPALQNLEGISENFSDVFVGGGGVSLAVADTNPSARIYMNDKDTRVAAFWKVTASDSVDELVDKLDIEPTWNLFTNTQSSKFTKDVDLAFQAIFLNRTAYSGILNAGPMGGKKQDGKTKISSRYNFKVLKEKILACHQLLADRTIVTCKDFREVLSTSEHHIAVYLDPPYVVKGNGLYPVGMSQEDHRDLAALLKNRANWLLSYDDCDLTRSLYSMQETQIVPARYCIGNNWENKRELLIGKMDRGKNCKIKRNMATGSDEDLRAIE
jgi:DNA adenine methylase